MSASAITTCDQRQRSWFSLVKCNENCIKNSINAGERLRKTFEMSKSYVNSRQYGMVVGLFTTLEDINFALTFPNLWKLYQNFVVQLLLAKNGLKLFSDSTLLAEQLLRSDCGSRDILIQQLFLSEIGSRKHFVVLRDDVLLKLETSTTVRLNRSATFEWKMNLRSNSPIFLVYLEGSSNFLLSFANETFYTTGRTLGTIDTSSVSTPLARGTRSYCPKVTNRQYYELNVGIRFEGSESSGLNFQDVIVRYKDHGVLKTTLCAVVELETNWKTSNSDALEVIKFKTKDPHYCTTTFSQRISARYPLVKPVWLNEDSDVSVTFFSTLQHFKSVINKFIASEEWDRSCKLKSILLKTNLKVSKICTRYSTCGYFSETRASRFDELYATVELTEFELQFVTENCTQAIIQVNHNNATPYEVEIEEVTRSYLYLRLPGMFVLSYDLSHGSELEVCITFVLDRTTFLYAYRAIERFNNWQLFNDTRTVRNINHKYIKPSVYIKNMSYPRTTPLLIEGPCGSGKTHELARTISVLRITKDPKILVCTHSDETADLFITRHLHSFSQTISLKCLRICSTRRWVNTVHPDVLQYCLIYNNIETGRTLFRKPTKADINEHQIIITTCKTSAYLLDISKKSVNFSHIFVDEATRINDYELMIPLCHSIFGRTTVILAGEHYKNSPEVYFENASSYQFDLSIFEKLCNNLSYINNRFLLFNQHTMCEELVNFAVKIRNQIWDSANDLSTTPVPNKNKLLPLNFHVTFGSEEEDNADLGYFNVTEIHGVVEVLRKIQKHRLKWKQTDIAVFAPYRGQVVRLKHFLGEFGYGSVAVMLAGCNFDQKLYSAVIISTVNTYRIGLNAESSLLITKNWLLSKPKVVYEVTSRATHMIYVIGDPMAVCSFGNCSKIWQWYLQHTVKTKTLHGTTWSNIDTYLKQIQGPLL